MILLLYTMGLFNLCLAKAAKSGWCGQSLHALRWRWPGSSCGRSMGMWHTMSPRGGVQDPSDHHKALSLEALLLLQGQGGDTGSCTGEVLPPSAGLVFALPQLPQPDEPCFCLHRTADMPATPRPALLSLLSLLLLHVPHAARAQVNPGKPYRDQVPSLHSPGVCSCQMAGSSESSPSSLGLSQLWEQYVMAPKPRPARLLCCPAPHLGTCSDLQSPSACPWQLAGCSTWQIWH